MNKEVFKVTGIKRFQLPLKYKMYYFNLLYVKAKISKYRSEDVSAMYSFYRKNKYKMIKAITTHSTNLEMQKMSGILSLKMKEKNGYSMC